jgi:hypothetical protein
MTSELPTAAGSVPAAPIRAAAFERPGVLIVNRLGDQLMALPAVRALCALFPRGVQLLLGEDMRAFFYRGLPVGEPVRLRWSGEGEAGIDVDRAARTATGCDLLLCLSPHPIWFVGPLAARLGARLTIGYGEGLDHRLYLRDGDHVFDSEFAIARQLDPGLRLEDFSAPPEFSPAAERAAREFLAAARGAWPRVLFVHPETSSDRMWERARLAWVLDRFLAARPDYMAMVASLEPFDLGDHGGRVRWINSHLELTLALMRHMDLFLGMDSLFLHAADLFRIPGLALFGPTLDWQKGFRFSPHGRHLCAASMAEIRQEPVLDALLDIARLGPAPREPEVRP